MNGQNVYPHDLERIAEEIDGVELGRIAVCGIYNTENKKEEIVIFVVSKRKIEVLSDRAKAKAAFERAGRLGNCGCGSDQTNAENDQRKDTAVCTCPTVSEWRVY